MGSLVVFIGESQPLVEGDSSISILINSLELILAYKKFDCNYNTSTTSFDLTTSLPELKSKLLRKSSGSIDHPLELIFRNCSVKISISRDEGSEEDVVQLDVAVVAGILACSLHKVDKFVL